MEETSKIKSLFVNYLRDLYIELTPEELIWVKEKHKSIVISDSWCAVISHPRLMKGLLSYHLISEKCPEYKIISTVDLVGIRFSMENADEFSDIVSFPGVLIIRHSASFIRNKLMLESLMHVCSERMYSKRKIIVVSDTVKDSGEYVYYDHEKVITCIGGSIPITMPAPSLSRGKLIPDRPLNPRNRAGARVKTIDDRPLANTGVVKHKKESVLKSRSESIEESAKKCSIE